MRKALIPIDPETLIRTVGRQLLAEHPHEATLTDVFAHYPSVLGQRVLEAVWVAAQRQHPRTITLAHSDLLLRQRRAWLAAMTAIEREYAPALVRKDPAVLATVQSVLIAHCLYLQRALGIAQPEVR